ncbi:MAG: sensor histidine kinase [Actinophytocola sp.]|uniref:sensor histidine kinase n=1 Tax=Actinophytocola sp. TaxID=1872138 RepID=UPI001329FBAB|nr:sensor histidine kinase [Actinophytocola sp.]MPZ83186.1 sensor histidine kinase [Actinophytocola sp.]
MSTRTGASERAWRRWQHVFFYSWLILATAAPLADRASSGRDVLLPLLLVALLACWYTGWLRFGSTSAPRAVYLAGAGAVWLALLVVDGSFLLLGLNVFAPFCMESRRVGFAVVGLCSGGWLWQRFAAADALTWSDIVIALLIAGGGAVAVGYVSSLVRVSAERKWLLDQLRAAQDDLAAAQREAGIAEERQRLARDIHDTLAQGFASMVLLLEAADATLPADDPARRPVEQALRTARESLIDSRQVVWALRSSDVDAAGLPNALRRLVDRLREETGMAAEAVVTGTPLPLDTTAHTALLRVAREALANVRKHAHADRADVTLSYMDDAVVLDVHDDGTGFDPTYPHRTNPTGHLGLVSMRERVEALGGTLLVETVPGEGTTVVATVPASPRPAENPASTSGTRRAS